MIKFYNIPIFKYEICQRKFLRVYKIISLNLPAGRQELFKNYKLKIKNFSGLLLTPYTLTLSPYSFLYFPKKSFLN